MQGSRFAAGFILTEGEGRVIGGSDVAEFIRIRFGFRRELCDERSTAARRYAGGPDGGRATLLGGVARPVLTGLVGWRSHKMTHHAVSMVKNVSLYGSPDDASLLSLRDPARRPGCPATRQGTPSK
jgi:hypothetical protein